MRTLPLKEALAALDSIEWSLRHPPQKVNQTPLDHAIGHLVEQGLISGAKSITGDLFGSRRFGGAAAKKALAQAKKAARQRELDAERVRLLSHLDRIEAVLNTVAQQLSPKSLMRLRKAAATARTSAQPKTLLRRDLELIGAARVEIQGAAHLPAPGAMLQELEHGIRALIRTRLSSDPAWWQTRIPSDVRQRAEERAGGRRPLVDFIDFGDYMKIITQRNNWEQHFRHVFPSREWIVARLNDLAPIRNDIAHSRVPSYDAAMKLRIYSREILERSA